MSEENVEIGLRFAAALGRREVPEDLLAPGFVLETVDTPVIQGTYIGGPGLEDWFRDFFDVFVPATFQYHAEPTDIGENVVIAKIGLRGRGRVSDAPLDLTHWGVLWIEDQKIVRAVGYPARRKALEAAGLSE